MLHVTYLLLDSTLTLDNSPVFQSQTLDWLRIQQANNAKVGLVCTVQDWIRFEKVAGELLRECQVPYVTVPHQTLQHNLIAGARALRRFNQEHPTRNIYARGIWGSLAHWLAFPLGGPRLLYDFRGDGVAEAEARGHRPFRHRLLRCLTRWAIRHADQLLCISSPAAELLEREYGRPGAIVIPSAVDSEWFHSAQAQRQSVRSSLNLKDTDLLLTYSGGLNSYQMVSEMLRLWYALLDTPGVRFLLLLNQQPTDGQFPSLDGLLSTGTLEMRSVPREQVPAYLAASDVGFLIRQDHPVNNVASPVKFGEYLASGLAVVTSPGLGDVSRMVEERDLGILISPEDSDGAVEACHKFLPVVRKNREGFRSRSQEAAAEMLDWNAHLSTWKQLVGIEDMSANPNGDS